MHTISIIIFLVALSGLKFSESNFCLACLKQGRKIVSFIIGASIVTLFTQFLNDIYLHIHKTNDVIVLMLPFSFIVFSFIGRHIYHHQDLQKKGSELQLFAKTISFFEGIFVGIIAISFLQESLIQQLVFLSILISYDLISDLSLHTVHEQKQKSTHESLFEKCFLSLSPIYGLTIAWLLALPESVITLIMALFAGGFMYLMIREILPQEKRAMPSYLILGSLMMTFLFLIDLSL